MRPTTIVVLFLPLLIVANSTLVQAEPRCMVKVIGDVAAEEAPEQVKSKTSGEFGPVTRIKVNKTTGRMLYCGKDTYCYTSNGFEFSTPCRIKLDKSIDDDRFFIYFTR